MDNIQPTVKNKILLVNLINNIGWTLILTLGWTLLAAFEIYREAIFTSDHLSIGLESHLHSDKTSTLNRHLESNRDVLRKKDIRLTPNTILIVDKEGKITGSTVKAWEGSNIFNPIFGTGLFNNKKISQLKRCLSSDLNCSEEIYTGDYLSTESITSIRPLETSHMGMSHKYGYVVVLFNHADTKTELLLISVLGLFGIGIITTLMSMPPMIYLTKTLCPFVFTALQKDSLTKLNNRAIFTEQAIIYLESAELKQLDYVLAIIDIDNFKNINDNYGHAAGDTALSEYSLIIDQTIRQSSDLCARFGGEEFSLLLRCDRKSAATILERLRLQIEIHNVKFNESDISTTISIGAASTEECGYNIDYLLMKADTALYNAKREGKNQVFWHETT